MQFRLPLRKTLLSLGLGVAVVAWIGSTFVRATVAPIQTALYLNCNTCSAQQPFEGLKGSPAYSSEAAATAAAEDGSALGAALQAAWADMNVHCRPCPPEGHVRCFAIGHSHILPGGEWWVVETGGQYFVLSDVPAGSKIWVCCEPGCY